MSGRIGDAGAGASRRSCLTELSVKWLVASAVGLSALLWLAIFAVI